MFPNGTNALYRNGVEMSWRPRTWSAEYEMLGAATESNTSPTRASRVGGGTRRQKSRSPSDRVPTG